MCLAVYKPANKIIPDAYFEAGFDNNHNGAGFCFHNGEQLMYVKGLMTIADFLASYHAHVKPEYSALIHFRFATLGPKDEEHTHPFVTSDGSCLIHNGPQIQNLGDIKRSDTREFVEDVLTAMDFETMRKAAPLVEAYLEYNKVVIMSPTGEVHIFNEKGGHWLDDCWYSNDGYKDWNSSSYMSRRYGKSTIIDADYEMPVGWATSRGSLGTSNSAFAGSYTHQMLLQAAQDSLELRADEAYRVGCRMASVQDQHHIEEYIDEKDYFEAFEEFFFREVNTGLYIELNMLMDYSAYCRMMSEPEEDVESLIAETLRAEVDVIEDDWLNEGMAPVSALSRCATNDCNIKPAESNIIEWPAPPTPPSAMIVLGDAPDATDRRVG